MIGMETNRLHQARNSRVQRMLKATLKTLKARLAELDHDIDDTIKQSPVASRRRSADISSGCWRCHRTHSDR